VSSDEPGAVRVSDLFDPEPETWGLRARLADQDVPASADELASLLHAAFRELAGTDLDTWRQRLMPVLSERARARLPGRA
jgi:hypothetical protein